MSPVVPCRAIVRPRVISPITQDALLLEDEIAELLQRPQPSLVVLFGPRCSGKSTALQHLAAVLPDERLLLLDDGQVPLRNWELRHQVIICVAQRDALFDIKLEMAPWSDDDVLEYLLAVAPERTASVIGRWRTALDQDLVEGCPEIVRYVLDRMIANGGLQTIRAVLHETFQQFLTNDDLARRSGMFALSTLEGLEHVAARLAAGLDVCLPDRFFRLMHPAGPRRVLAGLHLMRSVVTEERILRTILSRELIQECAVALTVVPGAKEALASKLASHLQDGLAMAVSILHAAGLPTHFEERQGRQLAYAVLDRVAWSGIQLPKACLRRASLIVADLSHSNLDHAVLHEVNLAGASLQQAFLANATGRAADFTAADLSQANLDGSTWENAKFVGANLSRANLSHSILCNADFREANLQGAILNRTDLTGARLEAADLRHAELRYANLEGAHLSDVQLEGACFEWAYLMHCDLEGVQLVRPSFAHADLHRALLTGSLMDAPNFQNANLRDAGLADIQWPNADLRNADLRGASFHLGSTRCGRVNSPYPSHGTRTGFYTNEYDEQTYRAPEEIRKADLQGADLRGACIEGVDFYLVDLRGARYGPDQLRHFEQCDAILHDRTPG